MIKKIAVIILLVLSSTSAFADCFVSSEGTGAGTRTLPGLMTSLNTYLDSSWAGSTQAVDVCRWGYVADLARGTIDAARTQTRNDALNLGLLPEINLTGETDTDYSYSHTLKFITENYCDEFSVECNNPQLYPDNGIANNDFDLPEIKLASKFRVSFEGDAVLVGNPEDSKYERNFLPIINLNGPLSYTGTGDGMTITANGFDCSTADGSKAGFRNVVFQTGSVSPADIVRAGDGSITSIAVQTGPSRAQVLADLRTRSTDTRYCYAEVYDVYWCGGVVFANPGVSILAGAIDDFYQGEAVDLYGSWCAQDADGDGVQNIYDPSGVNDCDDGNTDRSPELSEIPGNGIDENCNSADDGEAPVGSPEVCDGQDNDLDGLTDEDFDADADGYPTCGDELTMDCDDANSAVNPGKPEICSTTAATDEEDIDDNCDGVKLGKCAPGVTPDPTPSVDPVEEICTDKIDNNADTKIDCNDDDCKDKPVCVPENIDNDGDGLSENAGDCDDTDILITVCNGEMNVDDDGDGFTEQGGDCDDTDPDVSPGADEICDANPDPVADDDDCDRQDDDDANADVALCFDPNSEVIKPVGSGGSSGCGCDMGANASGSEATAVLALLAFGMMMFVRRRMND